MAKRMAWVVSPSKLCNLRCSYCYEWNELGNPARMSPELLRSIFCAVRDYHGRLRATYQRAVSNIAWLGGEPLILPVAYLEQLMAIENEVLGELNQQGEFFNAVQSNLYQLTPEALAFLRRHSWKVGVSVDVAPGVRVAVNGAPTERRVFDNIKRLQDAEVQVHAIVVVARHTAPRLVEIYQELVDRGITFIRFLPLFTGPSERPMAAVGISDDEIARAMERLFVYWFESGMKAWIEPLQEYLRNVLDDLAGVRGPLYDRTAHGESVLVVNTNGDLYQLLDTYMPERAMGKLGRDRIDDILRSAGSQWTHARDAVLRARMCGPCRFAGICNGTPALTSPREGDGDGRCPVTFDLYSFIDGYLREHAIGSAEVRTILEEILASPEAQVMS